MATPIGTNTVTAISRRYILPDIADNVYGDNVLFYRLNAANKKLVQGGTQIEIPLMYAAFSAGGAYQGFDVLDVSPSDTVQNAAFDWKQYYVPVSIDGLTLLKAESELAVANIISLQFQQSEMQMSDNLGVGLFTDGVTNTKNIDGLGGAVDDSTVLGTYGGIARSSNTWWKSQMDTATTTLQLNAMNTMQGKCRAGGRTTTLILTNQTEYNAFWALGAGIYGAGSATAPPTTAGATPAPQNFPIAPALVDQQLLQAGFTNLLFNNIPLVVDSHVASTANNNGVMFFLNEDYIYFVVASRVDFYMEDFQTPVNQDAMVAKLMWAGNLIFNNCQRQGKFTALTG